MSAKIRKTLWAIAATVVAVGAGHEAISAPKIDKDGASKSNGNKSQILDELTQYGGTAVGGVRG
jgi:hypothetical protein